MKKPLIITIIVFAAIFMVAGSCVLRAEDPLIEDIKRLDQQINELQYLHDINKDLVEQLTNAQIKIYYLEQDREVLRKRIRELEEWIEQWKIDEAELSFYAPLDSAAVEGMCYSGDPNITKSGARVEVGLTAAAGPDIPFGTLVMVEGLGVYEVQDRGGMIGRGKLDLTVETKKEALSLGRQVRRVAYRGVD